MSRNRGRQRRQDREKAGELHLFHAETVLGWRSVRMIDRDLGERFVARGWYRHVLDEMGQLVGYQPVRDERGEAKLQSPQSPVSLTAHDIQLIAGCYGPSRTEGMPEHKRLERRHPVSGRVLPAEDAIERARAKLAIYAESRIR